MPRRPAVAVLVATRHAAALAAAGATLLPRPAWAHPGQPIAPHDLWSAWTFEPGTVLALGLAAARVERGSGVLRARSTHSAALRGRRSLAFWTGWGLLVVALVSPLHALGGASFAAHMVQHELLIAVAAPLLVLARPAPTMLWSLPRRARRVVGAASRTPPLRETWRLLSLPLVAFLVQAAALWGWHLPGPYQATLRSDVAHALQHASFVGAAGLFWWAVLHPRGGRRGGGAALAALFVTTIHTGALGALLALAERPWYPAYGRSAWAWGLTPLEDQQLAGLVMWIPACLAYVVAALWIARQYLVESPGRRPEPAGPPADEGRAVRAALVGGER